MEEAFPSTSSNNMEKEPEELQRDYEPEPVKKLEKPLNMSAGAVKLRAWLNKSFRVEMTDGRILIGVFLCTDRDSNIILGSCSEYLPQDGKTKPSNEEPRMLGLVMIPGKHIVSIHIDPNEYGSGMKNPSIKEVNSEEVM
ncbi:hypothetical protein JTB14_018372 [Gonioctena quinquepunctata]|nr:hypothetical protein JTB14_018372 [Gonioctena quinquepunctata]